MFLLRVADSPANETFNQFFVKRPRGEDMVSLAMGAPLFDNPSEMMEAARKSMESGPVQYVSFPCYTPRLRSMSFWRRLLEKHDVAVPPEMFFGPSGKGHLRISFAAAPDDRGGNESGKASLRQSRRTNQEVIRV